MNPYLFYVGLFIGLILVSSVFIFVKPRKINTKEYAFSLLAIAGLLTLVKFFVLNKTELDYYITPIAIAILATALLIMDTLRTK